MAARGTIVTAQKDVFIIKTRQENCLFPKAKNWCDYGSLLLASEVPKITKTRKCLQNFMCENIFDISQECRKALMRI